MESTASRTISLNEATLWQADKRLLPLYLRASDNTKRIRYCKKALRKAIKTRLSPVQGEHLLLFYGKHMTKTQIGSRYGVGSSTVCKTLKKAEDTLREYIELYMEIYDLLEREGIGEEDDEYGELWGG